MDFAKLLAAVPDIGDKQAREMTIARQAHAGGVAAEYKRNLDAETMNRNARGMFVARLENMQTNGDHWLTVTAVLALLNDCDMLASNERA